MSCQFKNELCWRFHLCYELWFSGSFNVQLVSLYSCGAQINVIHANPTEVRPAWASHWAVHLWLHSFCLLLHGLDIYIWPPLSNFRSKQWQINLRRCLHSSSILLTDLHQLRGSSRQPQLLLLVTKRKGRPRLENDNDWFNLVRMVHHSMVPLHDSLKLCYRTYFLIIWLSDDKVYRNYL